MSLDLAPLCRELIDIDAERKRLKAELDHLQDRRDQIEATIAQEIENGSDFQSTKLGGITVYVATTFRPHYRRSRADLVAALKAAGLGDLVKEDYNANTLYSYTNELIKAATDGLSDVERRTFDTNAVIPESLREDLSLAPKFEIRTTRGK